MNLNNSIDNITDINGNNLNVTSSTIKMQRNLNEQFSEMKNNFQEINSTNKSTNNQSIFKKKKMNFNNIPVHEIFGQLNESQDKSYSSKNSKHIKNQFNKMDIRFNFINEESSVNKTPPNEGLLLKQNFKKKNTNQHNKTESYIALDSISYGSNFGYNNTEDFNQYAKNLHKKHVQAEYIEGHNQLNSFNPFGKVKPKKKNYLNNYNSHAVSEILNESENNNSGHDLTILNSKINQPNQFNFNQAQNIDNFSKKLFVVEPSQTSFNSMNKIQQINKNNSFKNIEDHEYANNNNIRRIKSNCSQELKQNNFGLYKQPTIELEERKKSNVYLNL